ncbi:MAG: putative Ribonuclease VapC4 [Nitrosopumilales archaeon]|nr:MAG: putative Ribonuclease VapC4 [Nitrosopumilales archaeon]
MVEVICDSSFLIHLATKKIKNMDNLDTEIGQIQFIVPDVVRKELQQLCENKSKRQAVLLTLDFIKKLKILQISGNYADESLVSYVRENGGIIATVDKELKNKVKELGGSIISLSNDRIVLES